MTHVSWSSFFVFVFYFLILKGCVNFLKRSCYIHAALLWLGLIIAATSPNALLLWTPTSCIVKKARYILPPHPCALLSCNVNAVFLYDSWFYLVCNRLPFWVSLCFNTLHLLPVIHVQGFGYFGRDFILLFIHDHFFQRIVTLSRLNKGWQANWTRLHLSCVHMLVIILVTTDFTLGNKSASNIYL